MPSKYNDSSDTNLRWFISHSNLPHYFRFCSTMVRCFWLHFCQIVFFVCSRKAVRLFWVFLPYHFGNIYFRNMPFKCQTRKQFWTSLHFMHVLKRNRKLTRWIYAGKLERFTVCQTLDISYYCCLRSSLTINSATFSFVYLDFVWTVDLFPVLLPLWLAPHEKI